MDVFFHPSIGWRTCDNEEPIWVIKWVYIYELNNFDPFENLRPKENE